MIAHSNMTTDSIRIDEAAALAALNGDRKLLCELAQICVEDTPELLREIDEAVAANQIDVARRLIHSLRGLSSTFFASPTTELARRLEEAASQGRVDLIRNGGVEQLRNSLLDLISELRMIGLAK